MLNSYKCFFLNLKGAKTSFLKLSFLSTTAKNENQGKSSKSPIDIGPEPNYQKLNPDSFKLFENKEEFQTVTNKDTLSGVKIVSYFIYILPKISSYRVVYNRAAYFFSVEFYGLPFTPPPFFAIKFNKKVDAY